jgi:hypothetical protein
MPTKNPQGTAPAKTAARQGLTKSRDLMRDALHNFGGHTSSGAMAACIAEHTNVLHAMDQFYERVLYTQVRFESAPARYESQAEDERDRLLEAAHKRTMAQLRRDKEELQARRELESYSGLDPYENELHLDAEHKRNIGQLRRKKEALEARRQVVSAKHGLEAERTLKGVRFALGKRRLESKIAEVEVGVAVARDAAGQDRSHTSDNESGEVVTLQWLIDCKQKEIEDAEADGKDTTVKRAQLSKLKELLALA